MGTRVARARDLPDGCDIMKQAKQAPCATRLWRKDSHSARAVRGGQELARWEDNLKHDAQVRFASRHNHPRLAIHFPQEPSQHLHSQPVRRQPLFALRLRPLDRGQGQGRGGGGDGEGAG